MAAAASRMPEARAPAAGTPAAGSPAFRKPPPEPGGLRPHAWFVPVVVAIPTAAALALLCPLDMRTTSLVMGLVMIFEPLAVGIDAARNKALHPDQRFGGWESALLVSVFWPYGLVVYLESGRPRGDVAPWKCIVPYVVATAAFMLLVLWRLGRLGAWFGSR